MIMYYLVKINNLWLVISWMIILLLKLKKKLKVLIIKKITIFKYIKSCREQLWIINKIILYRASFYNIYKNFNFIL